MEIKKKTASRTIQPNPSCRDYLNETFHHATKVSASPKLKASLLFLAQVDLVRGRKRKQCRSSEKETASAPKIETRRPLHPSHCSAMQHVDLILALFLSIDYPL
jgi:hypothetical protein